MLVSIMMPTACTTSTKVTGATILLTRAMNQSLIGFTAAPTAGHSNPAAMPGTAEFCSPCRSAYFCSRSAACMIAGPQRSAMWALAAST